MKRSYFTGRRVKSGPTIRKKVNTGASEKIKFRGEPRIQSAGKLVWNIGGEGNHRAEE